MKNLKQNWSDFLTIFKRQPQTQPTHETDSLPIREKTRPITDSFACPYCQSQTFVKRGFRQKKLERVQLYLCQDCRKTFSQHRVKGKHYPLSILLDGLSLYHLGYSFEQTAQIIRRRSPQPLAISPATVAKWLQEFNDHCPFARMRPYALKKYSPQTMVATAALAHRQVFRYRFHRAKCRLITSDDFRNRRFGPLEEFLEMVPAECPHQYFSQGLRASETPLTFSKKQMIVRAKQNYANQVCQFVLQSVKQRKNRHQALQRFMLYNDSVTVATEVPVYLTKEDLLHMQTQLGFQIYSRKIPNPLPADATHQALQAGKSQIPNKSKIQNSNNQNTTSPDAGVSKAGDKPQKAVAETAKSARDRTSKDKRNSGTGAIALPRLITGHIDILQIRNGQIHILDYKPKAEKSRPIEQLTLYAMALSRLTGLRLFEFKCAWFDENDYFEFYPLHVLHKPKKGRRRRKVYTMEGIYNINKNAKKIESVKPIKE